jgi:predicted RND superfamily exporter protein
MPAESLGSRAVAREGFERWGRFVFRNPKTLIALVAVVALGLGSRLPELRIDGSDEAFLPEADPVRRSFDLFRAQFGRDGMIAIAIEPPEVFDLGFLERLEAFHRDIEADVPHLNDVTSLVNARYTHGRGDELIVEDLLEEWPRSPQQLAELRERVLSNPLYRNYLISLDGRVTAVMVELDTHSAGKAESDTLAGFDAAGGDGDAPALLTGPEILASARALERLMARHQAPDFALHVAGGPMAEATLMAVIQRDIAVFVSAAILVMSLLLYLLFRRLSGVVLPLLVVILALLCTLGTMAVTDVAITLPVQVLPSFLLAVGICASVHLLTLFFRMHEGGSRREDAIAYALGHSGLPVVMTSLTTAAGLASFATADLTPVMHFGIFGPVGVLFALVFTLVLLPALLAVTPLREGARAAGFRTRRVERVLALCGTTASMRPRAVLAATAGLLLLALAGVLRLEFSHQPWIWLPASDPTRRGVEFFNREFLGGGSLEVLLDAGVENGFHDPELLQRLDELRVYAETIERGSIRVGKTVSVADVLKEIHQALNENRASHYAIPQDRPLVAQEFLLFENAGSDDLEDVVDSRFQLASFTLRVPNEDAIELAPFIDEVEAHFREVLGRDVGVTMTGSLAISSRTFAAVIPSMTRSYAVAFLAITPLMILLLRSFRRGLLSMIPNLVPVLLTLGLMGWIGFPLDISTMMIGAILLGVAVDDTIHFMHGFYRDYDATGEPERAIGQTLQTTGRAMLFTSIVLAAGFFIMMLATVDNVTHTGALAGFAIVVAFLADVLLAPALLVTLEPRHSPARVLDAGTRLDETSRFRGTP